MGVNTHLFTIKWIASLASTGMTEEVGRELTVNEGGLADFSTTAHWIDLSMVVVCILSAGLAAGLCSPSLTSAF